MNQLKILIVDDDREIRKILRIMLEKENYQIWDAENGEEALKVIDDSFDLIILDIMMPEKDGISTCIDIRKLYRMPILFLTAKATEYDKHIGFLTGCDDYLAKPFSSLELIARVAALIRRYTIYRGKVKPVKGFLQVKDLTIDEFSNRVKRGEQEINLTQLEYKIFLLFVQNPKKIFTLQNIFESAWGETYDYTVNSTVMVHIKNLRKKLDEDVNHTKYIKNIWGRGYCIETD